MKIIKNELNQCKRGFSRIRGVLSTKDFWMIQGLNLYLVVKSMVSYIMLCLSLIVVVSSTSQGLHLSVSQKGSILSASLFLVVLWTIMKALKNIFNGSDGDIEFLRVIANSLLLIFIISLAFSINVTDYRQAFSWLLRWFVLFALFYLDSFLLFRKLGGDVRSGKKTDWFRNIERIVTNKYENGTLASTEVTEIYKLKYSRIILKFKFNRSFVIAMRGKEREDKV